MIKGFLCDKTGKKVSFEECHECALVRSRCDYTYQMLKGMSVLIRAHKEGVVHATELMPCLRRSYYDRFQEVYLKPRDMFVRFRGQLGHLVCEKWQPEKGSIVEQTFTKQFDGVTVTGRPDEVIPGRKLIRDYKTTRYVKNANLPYGNHREQLLIYRALVDPIEIDGIEVVYFDMARVVRWCLMKKNDKNQDGWNIEKVNGWMEKKAKQLVKACKDKVPPPIELDETHWLCKSYCEVRHICRGAK